MSKLTSSSALTGFSAPLYVFATFWNEMAGEMEGMWARIVGRAQESRPACAAATGLPACSCRALRRQTRRDDGRCVLVHPDPFTGQRQARASEDLSRWHCRDVLEVPQLHARNRHLLGNLVRARPRLRAQRIARGLIPQDASIHPRPIVDAHRVLFARCSTNSLTMMRGTSRGARPSFKSCQLRPASCGAEDADVGRAHHAQARIAAERNTDQLNIAAAHRDAQM